MGKYRPNIVIRTGLSDTLDAAATLSEADPRYDEICARLEEYSITPRTLKSVTEFCVSSPVAASSSVSAASLEEYISLEQYSYGESSVSRYRIKSELITADPATSEVLEEGSSISKGDSASIASSKYPPSMSKESILHSLEKFIIKQVIKGFLDGSSAVSVIDIFERNLGKEVNLESTGHPITHSVVLHFVAGSVCVIDPSNFLFSSHLKNTDFNDELGMLSLPTIETFHKDYVVYKAIGDTGYEFAKSRDCTDIAIKIALGLISDPMISFTLADIKSSEVLTNISNNKAIDKHIIFDCPSRVKQASSLTAIKAFTQFQNLIDDMIKMKVLNDSAKALKWKGDYSTVITTEATHDIILGRLKSLGMSIQEEFIMDLKDASASSEATVNSFLSQLAGTNGSYFDY